MVLLLSLLALLAFHQSAAATVTDGTELVFAFMIHRHGDRTPIDISLSFVANVIDAEAVQELIAPWGYGQLTDAGKQRAYRTGQFIRRRYDELLSDTFNRSEIYIRSTDSTRTKMTVLTAMSAVYPAVGDTWSDEVNWVPVPYTTVPVKYDFNQYSMNCPVYTAAASTLMMASSPGLDEYTELLTRLSDILGANIGGSAVFVYMISDVLISLRNLGYDLDPEILNLMPELRLAAGEAAQIIYGDSRFQALQAGPLLNDFFVQAAAVIAGNDTQRVRVYSAHDVNVFALEAITQIVDKQHVPQYASLYALELRRVTDTGKYVVLPVYLPTPEEPEMYLTVEGCGGGVLCDFNTFYDITAPYLRTEDEWRTECGFTNDLVIDSSSVD